MNQLVRDTLSPLGIPVAYLTYTGSETEYIVFKDWNVPLSHADNKEIATNYSVQIDYFKKGNFIDTAKQIHDLMINAGFMKMLEDGEYDEEVGTFRKIFRFSYSK